MLWQRTTLLITTSSVQRWEWRERRNMRAYKVRLSTFLISSISDPQGLLQQIVHMQRHKQTWREGGNPFVMFLFHTDRMGGENPLPLCFCFTQTWREGETLSHHVSVPHRCNKRGNPSPVVFPSHTDVTRGGNPLPSCSLHTQTQWEGGNPLPSCFCSTQTWWGGESLPHYLQVIF